MGKGIFLGVMLFSALALALAVATGERMLEHSMERARSHAAAPFDPTMKPPQMSAAGGSGAVMDGFLETRWVWIKTLMNDGETVEPKNGTRAFSLNFGTDQRLFILTDCNDFSGNFIVDGSNLVLGELVGTREYCDGSQEDVFVRDVTRANHFLLGTEAEYPVLVLRSEDAAMYFEQEY